MKTRLLPVALVVLMVGALAPAATATSTASGVYISLGDSLAAGFQAGDGFVTDDGYTDVLFQRVKGDLGLGTHVKLGCPGETSTTLITGGCPATGVPGVPVYSTATQLGDALLAITAAGPDLALITIDIGANDVLACVTAPDLVACLSAALTLLAGNLTFTLATLQAAAPGVPIVGMNYYNPNLAWVVDDANAPFPGFGLLSQDLVSQVNDLLGATYAGAFGPIAPVPMVDIAAAFGTFDDKHNVRDVCRFTQMCEKVAGEYVMIDWDPVAPGIQPDIHASDLGYKQMAWAFKTAMEMYGII